MRIPKAQWIAALLVIACGAPLGADRVRLRSGKVVEGMEVVDAFNSKYGESLTSLQGQIYQEGNVFLAGKAPDLDFIKKATILP